MQSALRFALLVGLCSPVTLSAQTKPVTNAAQAQAVGQVSGPLLVIDDVIIGNGLVFQMTDMAVLNVVSFEVVKSELAVRLYGERARAGAVIVRTLKSTGAATTQAGSGGLHTPGQPGSGAHQYVQRLLREAPAGKEPLIVVDGVALGMGNLGGALEKYIGAETIQVVTVEAGSSGVKKYGEQAVNGTIMITTKANKN